MSLILALALFAQTSSAERAREDLEFARAVEESVAAPVPDGYRGLFALLGADAYRGREDATTRLESALRRRPEDTRWLFLGRLDRDPEIRSRCNAILRRLNPCPGCKGAGVQTHGSYSMECWDCRGCRTVWIYGMFD